MNLSDIVAAHEGLLRSGSPGVEIRGLTADSRAVEPGFLFAALPGVAVDGARFIDQALSAGAAAVLTHEDYHQAGGFQGDVPATVALLVAPDPRFVLAEMAARFYYPQPSHQFAVTGTNGKTSVASFVRQIWQYLGIGGASLGTVGVVSPLGETKLSHTTPEPVTLHHLLQELAVGGVDHVIVEASSHGLAQRRLDGMQFEAAAFTNITRDHLDYHKTFDAYFAEKQRLFTDLLAPSGAVVVDADAPGADEVIALCQTLQIPLMTIGKKGRFLRVQSIERDGFGQTIRLSAEGQERRLHLPLVGDFQVSNALVAAAMVAAGGVPLAEVLSGVETLKGAVGRLERVGDHAGAPIFVDYAHTPDALGRAIEALLPYKTGRLIVVFGCGGDRDQGKRALMGALAVKHADHVIVTDDNPRGEEAAAIRAQILQAASGADEIGDRAEAIAFAVSQLRLGDVLLVAGKGHETGQIVGDKVLPFSDHLAVQEALAGL